MRERALRWRTTFRLEPGERARHRRDAQYYWRMYGEIPLELHIRDGAEFSFARQRRSLTRDAIVERMRTAVDEYYANNRFLRGTRLRYNNDRRYFTLITHEPLPGGCRIDAPSYDRAMWRRARIGIDEVVRRMRDTIEFAKRHLVNHRHLPRGVVRKYRTDMEYYLRVKECTSTDDLPGNLRLPSFFGEATLDE